MTEIYELSREYEIGESDFLVMLSDKSSTIVYTNPAYQIASGYTADELKGAVTATMLHKETPQQVSRDMLEILGSRQPWTGIIKNRRKNGDYYWLRLNISPLYSQGNYAGSLLVHSKPTREEIAKFDAVYKLMRSGSHQNLVLRNGHPLRLTWYTKIAERIRKFGLNASIWGAMTVLELLSLTSLWSVSQERGSLSFWGAALCFTLALFLTGRHLSQSIVVPLRAAVRFANETAAGDLGSQMNSMRSDEIGSLMRALSQMSVNMRATVVDVRDGVGLMQMATADIAAGTVELSSRTQNQASHLQDTAASMVEMHETVSQTADASRQASDFGAAARSAAETSGRVIGEIIDTMGGITQSSKKIAEIIGVIDSIAFQTNILALNAAVEAARAGEQGRGFAVVAGEVRNLAQRSAQSAREIRTLIVESVAKVDNGSKLVNSAGKTIEDVVSQVRRVTELVSRIAEASLEQSAGIGQINQGVGQLEEVTRQNTNLVQENTGAAESLREQAARLAEAVSVFKLSRQETLALFNAGKVAAADMREMLIETRAA